VHGAWLDVVELVREVGLDVLDEEDLLEREVVLDVLKVGFDVLEEDVLLLEVGFDVLGEDVVLLEIGFNVDVLDELLEVEVELDAGSRA